MYETLIYLVFAYVAAFALDRAYGYNSETARTAKTGISPKSAHVPKIETFADQDAVDALRTLGYSKNEAVLAVRGVQAQARHGNLGTAELVKAALRQAMVKVV